MARRPTHPWMSRRTLTVTALLAVALGALALGRADAQGPPGPPKKGGVLRVAMIGEPPSLDPHLTTATIAREIGAQIFETLYALDGRYEPVPFLAEGHDALDGGKRYVIRLRKGVRFHNGKELEAADVVASLKRWGRLATPGKQLFKDVEGLEASPIEIERGGTSYTADTVGVLRAAHPGAELYLVVGADIVPELDSWDRVEQVRDEVVLAVVDRAGEPPVPDPEGWEVRRVPMPELMVSSSELRRRLAQGRPVDFLVPAEAIRCIRARGLYALGR